MEDKGINTFLDGRFKGESYLFWLILILAAGVRLYYSFHYLLSDEVFNLLAIETLSSKGDFHPYFFKHPPLYTLLSAFLYHIIGPYPQLPSYLSIFFSVASSVPFYFIAKCLMGRRVAIWACLLLSVMPANVYYSTWIKQDAMLLFFFLWGLYLYLTKRHMLAGLIMGIALLVKEFALFFFPLSFLITLIERKEKGFNVWRGWLITFLLSSFISGWWYIWFGKAFYLIAGEALTGAYIVEWYWHFPWWFFLRNLPFDLSYPLTLFFIMGVVFMGKEFYERGYIANQSVPLVWIAVFYIPLSFMHMKTPWFIYLATPALAIVAAFGVVELISILRSWSAKVMAYVILSVCLISVLQNFDHLKYNDNISSEIRRSSLLKIFMGIQGVSWEEMIRNKVYWEEKIKGVTGKVGFLEYSPLLQYFMGIGDEKVVKIRVSKFMALDREGLLSFARATDIGVFILFADSLTYSEKNLEDMVSLWGAPERVGPLLVFQTK